MGRRVSFVLIGFLAVYTLIMTFMTLMTVQSTYPMTELSGGFDVELRGETYENIALTEMEAEGIGEIKKGDVMTISRILPDTKEVPFPTLSIKLRYSAVEVFLEDRPVYSYKMKELEDGAFIGSERHFILLPRGAESKKLTIVLHITRDNAFRYISTPVFGDYDDVAQSFLHDYIFSFVSGLYLFIFGVLFLVIALLFARRVPEMRVTLASAVLCIVLSGWILAKHDLLNLFFSVGNKTIVEYSCLYLIPPIVAAIVWITKNFVSKKIFLAYSVPLYVVAGWNFFGVLTGAFEINRFRTPYYVTVFISIVAVMIETVFCFRRKLETANQIQMISLTMLNLFFVVEYVVYFLEMRSPWIQSHIGGVMMPAGGMLFSLGQVMNFFIFVTQSYVRRAEAASLRRMAYEDILTGLPNRASFDREARQIDTEGVRYGMISLDLNGLKETNDTLGHATGDRLLSSFGKLLKEVFGDVGFCARTGGDEFVVILRGATLSGTKDDVERRLLILEERLKQLDKTDGQVLHSAAYGYAFSEELESPTTHDVFLLADSRMYDRKRAQHTVM